MKTKMRFIKYLLFLAGIIVFFSCNKSIENKLVGTWKVVNVTNINDTTFVEKWQFDSDGNLKINYYTDGGNNSVSSSSWKYSVSSYKKLILKSNDSASYSEDWKIAKLKKDILIMTYESGGLQQKEFVKN
jgi:hypothetical protein